ncbi:unnamed protein product [Rotaria magnacalcarata]|uniref:RRM domain-containing protein n=5 Tax=Rotaria TaxID=231623 RepID=A0A816L7B1_9BILA|nr:unnamed protein product [Rotaria magnacalcarata]CAF1602091.1 unnamed protein product [Rotaria magnacalcarata]CAF1931652.1 unnamed protein product [Rotaria magnacalcarata]CAF1943859.1 unnamed protein product [Rotaria magnacalcarata]CAF2252068.1 unnamed protein product [Rotaria magnacalcarata]
MTTRHSDNDFDTSRIGQISSASPARDSGYIEHTNNGQGENGYSVDINDSQNVNLSQTGYSQGSGSGTGTSIGSKPEDERKLFVGGLTWDTTQEDLREYFSSFGNVLDCSIKHDPSTGRSRGFAFLVFDSKDIVERILSQNDHFVKGRRVDPKPAHRRLNAANNQMNNITNNNVSSQSSLYGVGPTSAVPYTNMMMGAGASANPYSNNRKVFIGGLDPSFPDTKLREYFSKFGQIDEIDLPYDKEKNERRPFCFISFQTEQAAQEVLRLQRHTIGDISVDVKRAKPKTMNNQQHQQLQQQVYDPYGQQATYSNYGAGVPSYGQSAAYQTQDAYTHWNAYTYNQQANPATYPYGSSGSTGAPSPGPSSYSQYPEHQSNSQYQYTSSTTAVNPSDYYSQYGYGAPQTTGVYAEPNAYSASYDYSSYYPSMNTGMSGTMGDSATGQQTGNSPGNQNDYDHDNHHGKSKTTIVASPTYHPYSRS